MPWLIALIVMVLSTGLWYQFESRTQQQQHIEQYMATLQVSVRPLLRNKDAELFNAQLNHLRYTSVVPLIGIAIFNQNNSLLSATEMPVDLQQFIPDEPVVQFSLQRHQQMLVALQPLPESASADAASAQYYMLTLFAAETAYSVWLVPMLIVALAGGAALLIVQSNLMQQLQRQQTDISLVNHKLSQLKRGQKNVQLHEELVPELATLKPAVNAVAQYQTDISSQHEEEKLQLQQSIDAMQQHNIEVVQQLNQLKQHYQTLQFKLQHRLQTLTDLQQQHAELDELTYQQALNAQLSLMQLDVGSEQQAEERLLLTDAVADALPTIQRWLLARQIELQLFEAADNALYTISLSRADLNILLLAMVQLGSRAPSVTELTLRLTLDVAASSNQASLTLSITSNGDGMTASLRQRLTANSNASLQWHETDIGILLALKQQLDARLTIQSLEGLGSTLSLQVPLTGVNAVTVPKLEHLLLFEQPAGNLTERGQCLQSQSAHLVKCADLAELSLKSTQYLYDLAVVVLPEPADLSTWRSLLQQVHSRCRLLCYAAAGQRAVWQEALQLDVQTGPVCLAHIQSTPVLPKQLPRLLVVDDNQTNLAFVKILFKDQSVQLFTASCGAEALKYCQQQQFDAILLDIQLPDISGTDVARQLRQLTSYQHTPILAFTAHALKEEVSAFKQAGMDDVIIKPLEAAKLEQILHWCLVRKTDDVRQ